MIDKNMMRIILILAICFLVGCASNENVVSVRQVKSDEPIVLRMRKDRTFIHSLLYPVAFEFKKNDSRDIYYAENSYWAKNKDMSPGTAGCFLWEENDEEHLSYAYKRFNGTIKYIIDKNDTIKERLSVYYKKMMDEEKDTIHVPLKEFNSNFGYIIDNFFEGDSIYLHFHDHKRWHDIPLRVSFD